LLERGAIKPETNASLDEIFIAHVPPLSDKVSPLQALTQETGPAAAKEKKVLLTRHAVPPILSLFNLPSSAASDIYRAIEQATVRLERGIYK